MEEGLSEYELERQKKIAQNKAMLAALGLDKTILTSISGDKKKKSSQTSKKSPKKSPKRGKKKSRLSSSDEDTDSDSDSDSMSEYEGDSDSDEDSQYSDDRGEVAEELNEIVSKDFDLRLEPEDRDAATGTETSQTRTPENQTNNNNNNNNKSKKSSDATPKKRAARKGAKQSGEGRQKRERDLVQVAEEIKHFSRIANGPPKKIAKANNSQPYSLFVPNAVEESSEDSSKDDGVRIMFSNVEGDYAQHVYSLKANMVGNPKRCTHLITGTPIKRSRKFFGAMRHARYIVSVQWLLESFKAGKFLSEKPYLIRDEEAERTWQFNLHASLVNRVRGGVFQQCQFFFCPGVAQASNFELNRIVEDANGKVLQEVLPGLRGFCFIVVGKEEVDAMKEKYAKYGHDIYFVDIEFIFLSLLRQSLCTEEKSCVY